MLSVCLSYFQTFLFVIIKVKAVHTDCVSFFDTSFFQFLKDSAFFEETLEECEAFLGIEDIMVYKEANDIPILQPEQEAKQKEWLARRMEGKRHKNEVDAVFEEITRNSKKIQARKLFDYNIVLIGFMGAGKSTISDFLRTVFAMEVVEMDQIIAEREGMSISDIFETYGEEYFRNLETELLIEMQSRKNVVISCGGGVPMRERNVVEMKKNGRVVLLTAKPETILNRVKDNHDRPLLEGNKNVENCENTGDISSEVEAGGIACFTAYYKTEENANT